MGECRRDEGEEGFSKRSIKSSECVKGKGKGNVSGEEKEGEKGGRVYSEMNDLSKDPREQSFNTSTGRRVTSCVSVRSRVGHRG